MSEGELQRRVGAFLRDHRQQLGLSQEAFAVEVGVHRTYMGSVERGEENLTLRSVEKLASILDADPIAMLTFIEGDPATSPRSRVQQAEE